MYLPPSQYHVYIPILIYLVHISHINIQLISLQHNMCIYITNKATTYGLESTEFVH